MGAFGLESDSILGPQAGPRRAMVAARLPRPDWPDRPTIVTAVDTHTGGLVAFDRDSGVDPVDAVTASCALPDLAPTHSINGSRYIDGGVRSTENADLAPAMRTSSCSRRWAGEGGQHRRGTRTREASSKACADHRNGEWTWPARLEPCAGRAVTSRWSHRTADRGPQWAPLRWIRPPSPRRPGWFRPRQAGGDPRGAALTSAGRCSTAGRPTECPRGRSVDPLRRRPYCVMTLSSLSRLAAIDSTIVLCPLIHLAPSLNRDRRTSSLTVPGSNTSVTTVAWSPSGVRM
jgi:hypothetical protein